MACLHLLDGLHTIYLYYYGIMLGWLDPDRRGPKIAQNVYHAAIRCLAKAFPSFAWCEFGHAECAAGHGVVRRRRIGLSGRVTARKCRIGSIRIVQYNLKVDLMCTVGLRRMPANRLASSSVCTARSVKQSNATLQSSH
jgi:hypothetical protein